MSFVHNRWYCIFLVLVALPAIILSALQEEVEPFLKSRPRKWYSSDEKFGQAIREFHNKVFNHEIHRKLKHHFIFRYDPASSCTKSACLNVLEQYFHKKRVNYVSPHHAIVSASSEEVNAFRASVPGFLLDASPLLPSMKVDANLIDIDCSKEENKQPIWISGELPYMPRTEYDAFLGTAARITERYNGVVTVESLYPQREKRISVRWTVRDCTLVNALVPLLASMREVVWLERQLPIVMHNRWAKGLMETGQTENSPMQWSGNFTGEGEVIGVVDTGIDMMNCYFYDPDEQANFQYQTTLTTTVTNPNHRKVLQYISISGVGDTQENEGGHGTHVAGIAAGECYEEKNYGDYAKFNGMAPKAKIAFADLNVGVAGVTSESITPPSDIETGVFIPLYLAGARVITNSWGNTIDASSGGSSYSSLSKDVDEFMSDYADALVLFSAGNSGYKNTAKTVSPPGNAKSCLTVGASGSDYDSWRAIQGSGVDSRYDKDLAAYFSAVGPTDDFRLKPEIMAPGFFTVSAKGTFNSTEPFCGYQILDGTSMATPTAAGYALMVRQYFTQGYYPSGVPNPEDGFTPSGALLKAILIHSGRRLKWRNTGGVTGTSGDFDLSTDAFVNITSSYPSTKQGFGRVQLDHVLHFGNSSRNPLSLFVMGGTNRYNSSFLATGVTTKSYVFYTDSSSVQPDIRVTLVYTDHLPASGATSSMVNVLSVNVAEQGGSTYTAYAVSGTSSQGPVKVVDIGNPKPSTKYTITVSASLLNRSPQPFALVATGNLEFITATNPADESFGPDYPFIAESTRNQIILLAIVFGLLVLYFVFVKSHTRKRKSVKVNNWLFNSKSGNKKSTVRDNNYDDYGELGISEEERRAGGTSLFRSLFYKDPVQQAIEASRRDEAERRRRERAEQKQSNSNKPSNSNANSNNNNNNNNSSSSSGRNNAAAAAPTNGSGSNKKGKSPSNKGSSNANSKPSSKKSDQAGSSQRDSNGHVQMANTSGSNHNTPRSNRSGNGESSHRRR
jgi:hypothetical protein